MTLFWTARAEQDLAEILTYVAADSPGAAARIEQRIHEVAARLEKHPFSARVGRLRGTRELAVPGLLYLLIYRVKDRDAHILRVWRGARLWPPRS